MRIFKRIPTQLTTLPIFWFIISAGDCRSNTMYNLSTNYNSIQLVLIIMMMTMPKNATIFTNFYTHAYHNVHTRRA